MDLILEGEVLRQYDDVHQKLEANDAHHDSDFAIQLVGIEQVFLNFLQIWVDPSEQNDQENECQSEQEDEQFK